MYIYIGDTTPDLVNRRNDGTSRSGHLRSFLADLKTRIRTARLRASPGVKRDLVSRTKFRAYVVIELSQPGLPESGVKLPTGGIWMLQTVEATIDETGNVRLLEPLRLSSAHRALVTILEEAHVAIPETALLSESALAADWNRPEEDEAWSHLQRAS